MTERTIRENEAGQRLDKYLRKYLKEAPDSFLYKMLRKKNITLNGRKASGSEQLHMGDHIKLFLSDETMDKFSGKIPDREPSGESKPEYEKAFQRFGRLEIIFENHHVLVVNKPAGILTQKAEPDDLSLNEWLIGFLLDSGAVTDEELRTFKPSVCNRLDRNTSGMVVCGKTLAGSQQMSRLLKERSLHKYYRFFVRGTISEPSEIGGYLRKDERTNKVKITSSPENGAPVLTKYRPLKQYAEMTLLEAELVTGKTHQIRSHFAAAGHPLLGDYKYGDRNFNDRYRKKYRINYQLLHAFRLEFPVMEKEFADMSGLVLTAQPPAVFRIVDENESSQGLR